METQNLQAFVCTAEESSFSQAAEILKLTQPAISKRIANLESQLGSKLFDRIGRQITLTEAGRVLLPRAKRILQEVESSRIALNNLQGRICGELSLGTSHHIGLHRLPQLLRSYSQSYPEVDIDLHFMGSEEAWNAVHNGKLEIALVTTPDDKSSGLSHEALWVDDMKFVCSAEEDPEQIASLSVLAGKPAILTGADTVTRQLVDQVFARRGLKARVRQETNYLETIKMMVSVGLGWSVLPENMLDETVREIPLKNALIQRHLGAIYRPDRTLSNAARALLRHLNNEVKR
ncbi:LysR family transcriptional regulator [Pelagibaculum spongiae]|uniref:LysR family transcriptional regulator n=1 Tax=Pelagibaculum spongiae TaxID=2080658 RepID=A0A2V1GZV6_9GAMM|nr:LysR family transcriptional regulator [Pelagibaculum spongiae]PVZ68871.1 LysR family transcriptional regulator [Pelagibaculum spongiae]